MFEITFKRNGGLRFLKIGRLQLQWSFAKKKAHALKRELVPFRATDMLANARTLPALQLVPLMLGRAA